MIAGPLQVWLATLERPAYRANGSGSRSVAAGRPVADDRAYPVQPS
jgi:hypothetical protein